jgi:hypothetical protein
VPRAIVPDNLKSGVHKAHRYEPELNRAYQDFAEHYDLAILPARIRKPRDKAKVEGGVLIVERWIPARLRNRTFFTLADLNAAIATLLERLSTGPFRKIEGMRRSRFKPLERPAMKALPLRAYEFGEWRKAKVHPDYHVEVGRAYYSVPYRFIGERVDVRLTDHDTQASRGEPAQCAGHSASGAGFLTCAARAGLRTGSGAEVIQLPRGTYAHRATRHQRLSARAGPGARERARGQVFPVIRSLRRRSRC